MHPHIAFIHFWTLRLRRGVETMVLSLANELARMDVPVSLLTARQTVEPLVKPSPQVTVHQFPTFRYYEAKTIIPFYVHCLKKYRPDVLVTFFADFGEGPALHWVHKFYQPKHILYLTFPYESAPHRYHAYQRWGWDRSADLILADAKYTAEKSQEIFKRPVQVLPSGTDPERFYPDANKRRAMRAKLGYQESDVVLLNVSALEERKGTWRVIEALPEIRKNVPGIRYLILGEGEQRHKLEQRASELGINDIVLFYGTTNDLAPIYNAADIFVMLSDAEAGSVALLEAMASGLPVIVSNSGGFSEVIELEEGKFVDIQNPQGIILALSQLAQDRNQRLTYGNNCRQIILKQFSWQSLAQKLCDLITKIA